MLVTASFVLITHKRLFIVFIHVKLIFKTIDGFKTNYEIKNVIQSFEPRKSTKIRPYMPYYLCRTSLENDIEQNYANYKR